MFTRSFVLLMGLCLPSPRITLNLFWTLLLPWINGDVEMCSSWCGFYPMTCVFFIILQFNS